MRFVCLALFFWVGSCLAAGTNAPAPAATSTNVPPLALLIEAAANGDLQAQYKLARTYEGEFDLISAAEWYWAASAQGMADAQYRLGRILSRDFPVSIDGKSATPKRDPGVAVKWLSSAANQGHTLAQLALARCYLKGDGVLQDYIEAYKWYSLANRKGNEKAGAERDRLILKMNAEQLRQARVRVENFHKETEPELAAANGDVHAQYQLAQTYEAQSDLTAAAKWYLKAANQGLADAQYRLAQILARDPALGVDDKMTAPKRDMVVAIKWYLKAANQGHALAQLALGRCYLTGNGVNQDYVAAYNWFTLAANQGNTAAAAARQRIAPRMAAEQIDQVPAKPTVSPAPEAAAAPAPAPENDAEAQYKLGMSYEDKLDLVTAAKYYWIAGKQGIADAQYRLGQILTRDPQMNLAGKITAPQRDAEVAVKWFVRAANQGHTLAQLALARCYRDGDGAKQDYVEAYKWFSLAAKQGNPVAAAQLEKIVAQMTPEQIAAGKKAADDFKPVKSAPSQEAPPAKAETKPAPAK